MKYPLSIFHLPSCLALVLPFTLNIALPTRAELSISAAETEGNVVFTFSGSLTVSNGTPGLSLATLTVLNPTGGQLHVWPSNLFGAGYALDMAVPFGSGGELMNIGVGTGDHVGFDNTELYLPETYVSGTPINTTLTFSGTDFATLGVDRSSGPYTWTLTDSGDTVVLSFPPDSPEVDNSGLLRKIRKLQKKSKKLKKKGKKAKAKKLLKKVKKLQAQLAALE